MTDVALTTWMMTDFFRFNGQGHRGLLPLRGYWMNLEPFDATKLATKSPNRSDSMREGEKNQLKFRTNLRWQVIPLGGTPTQNAYSVDEALKHW
jgi:hypothetical protein